MMGIVHAQTHQERTVCRLKLRNSQVSLLEERDVCFYKERRDVSNRREDISPCVPGGESEVVFFLSFTFADKGRRDETRLKVRWKRGRGRGGGR